MIRLKTDIEQTEAALRKIDQTFKYGALAALGLGWLLMVVYWSLPNG